MAMVEMQTMRRLLNPAAKCRRVAASRTVCTDALNGDDGLRSVLADLDLMSTITRGIDGMSLALFTEMSRRPIRKVVVWRTLWRVAGCNFVGHGIRYAAGHYGGDLSGEYGRKSWLAEVIRFINDILPLRRRLWLVCLFTPSWWRRWALLRLGGCDCAGAVAGTDCYRTTENMLKLVPDSLREAAYDWVRRSGR